jgi:hypothetical protein
MSGYSGYSMSNNALKAYSDGEMPMSKWSKVAILAAIDFSFFSTDQKKIVEKQPISILRKVFLISRGWHHTSKEFNKTPFFGLAEISDVETAKCRMMEIEEIISEKKDCFDRQKKNMIEFLTIEKAHFSSEFFESAISEIEKNISEKSLKSLNDKIQREYKI